MQSDQGVFHGIGIPFVYFGVEDHPDYHRPTDDVSRIDAGLLRRGDARDRALRGAGGCDPAAAEAARAVSGEVRAAP